MAQKVALDIGGKRTGIAITDSLNIIASGLKTVPTDDLLEALRQLFHEYDIDILAIGMPANLDGSPTDATPIVHQMSKKISQEFPEVKICFIDERFTSKIATQAILKSGAKKKQRQNKALVDQVSATIILQTYLEIYG